MNHKRLHRLVAASVFGYALVLYGSTVARTTSLWDAGEFIASAYGLQVMHPPGSPVYMLLGRLFSMFMPAGQVALAVNLVSVLAAALTILLTYLIIVELIGWWQEGGQSGEEGEGQRGGQKLSPSRALAIIGGIIGACTFAVTDSFWFNAVEAEVYALSMFFTALAVWLGLRWSIHARAEAASGAKKHRKSDRYLMLIAYVFGLTMGVHLMALLAFFFIALLFYFVRIEQPSWTGRKRVFRFMAAGVVSAMVFAVLYPGVGIFLPEGAGASGMPLVFLFGVALLLAAGLAYTHRRGFARANLAVLCLTAVLAGYSAYALVPIRSAADPPIDLNDPETTEDLVPYLKRQQYEQRDLLAGPTFDDRTGQLVPDHNVQLFPRRNSFTDASYAALYARYTSDADYFVRYQLGTMYGRYFLWNFAGKAKDEQGSGWITGLSDRETAAYVYTTPSEAASRNVYFALPLLLGLFGLLYHFRRDGRRALAVLALFLVTGVGLVIYLNEVPRTPRERDYIFVASFFAFTLWIGIGAAGLLEMVTKRWRFIAHARQQRETVASRFWILDWGFRIGKFFPPFQQIKKLRPSNRLDSLSQADHLRLEQSKIPNPKSKIAWGLGALIFLAVPGWMLLQNYDDHDRSGRYLARDFAYNMLMSVEENAILFTEGDNDTYPLWYLQEVEGVRPDVRVVCLALLNAPWYPKQLRDQWAYDAAPLPISLSDKTLDDIAPTAWMPRTAQLPVAVDQLIEQTEMRISLEDTSGFESPMRWTLEGRPYSDEMRVLYPVDHVVLDILASNAAQGWTRPIYFAATTSPDSRLGLDSYLQREGLAQRVVPIRHEDPFGRIVPGIMLDRLAKFRFTRLDDPSVYFDPSSRGMAGSHYRAAYAYTAATLADQGRQQEAKRLLDTVREAVPPDTIPLPFYAAYPMAQTYQALGEDARALDLWRYAEPYVFQDLQTATSPQWLGQAVQQVQYMQRAYVQARDFAGAAALGDRLADLLGDEAFRLPPEEFERLYEEMRQPDSLNPENG